MNWIIIAYLLGLIFLATKLEDTARRKSLRAAWIAFALIPFWHFLMPLCRAGDALRPRTLELIDIWDQAIPSLLLGISFLLLAGALAPAQRKSIGNKE